MSPHRDLWRHAASFLRPFGRPGFGALALGCAALVAGDGTSLAQVSEQQVRCMQLQQELAAAQGGGGASGEELRDIEGRIAQADRVYQGTQAAMEDAGCFDSFFIFGRGLVRSPKCLRMNARSEDARRDLTALKQQRKILRGGGGGNRRRQAELQDALARSGCAGAPKPRRGGLFDFFGLGRQEEEDYYQRPIYRSINPNGRYRSVCVRLCDGFYFPIHYSIYGSQLGPDSENCQSSCAAPAELYVYRNPGQEIEQAVSLTGSAYMDLPVALRFRKEYVKGCSCKQAEYNPTAIEGANKKAEADPNAAAPAQGQAAAPAPQAVAPATGEPPALQAAPDVTGSTTAPAEPGPPAAALQEEGVPALPDTAAPPPPPPAEAAAVEDAPPAEVPASVPPQQSPPPPPPAEAAAPAEPPPAAEAAAPPPAESAVVKRRRPAAPPASPFGPQ